MTKFLGSNISLQEIDNIDVLPSFRINWTPSPSCPSPPGALLHSWSTLACTFSHYLKVVSFTKAQGGQNFFEKNPYIFRNNPYNTLIFFTKSVQSVQFSGENPYNPYILWKKSVIFFKKICTISTIFEIKIPAIRTF